MADFPSPTSAYGVWSLNEIRNAIRGDNWPIVKVTDEYFANVSLLLHGDGTNGAQNNTFLDSSANGFTITRNGNTTQGSYSPYRAEWSNYFDGSGDYLTVPNNTALNLSTGDFTIEFWVYINAISDFTFIGKSVSGAYAYAFQYVSGNLRFYAGDNGSLSSFYTRSWSPSINRWYHLAITRFSSSLRFFVDGVQQGSTSTVTQDLSSTANVNIGRNEDAGGIQYVNGYMSDVRIVKGTALYTADFTPPTAPLTAVTGTSLLTCQSNRFIDNSSNGFAITVSGDTKVTPLSPYAPSDAYDPATHGGSGYFDGGFSNYITVSDAADFDFGTGDFTVECWFYEDGLVGSFVILGATEGVNQYWGYGAIGSGGMTMYAGSSGTDIYSGTANTPQAGQWNHLVWQRDSGTASMYINGERVYNASYTADFGSSATGFRIGRSSNYSNYYTNGKISDFRVIKGSAVYSGANFTPPITPLTAVTNTSFLCNFDNAGIFDSTGKNFVYTVGDAQIDTAVTKFGTGSMQFDGTGDWLYPVDNTDFVMGTGDFTIEMWINVDNFSDYRHLYDDRVGGNGAYITIRTNLSGQLEYVANAAIKITGSTVMSAGSWYHVAVCRSGTSTRMFLDGVQQGSTYNDSTNYISNPNRPVIAAHGFNTSQYPYIGYMDDIRITKGVARYTANFTPPTAPFPDQ